MTSPPTIFFVCACEADVACAWSDVQEPCVVSHRSPAANQGIDGIGSQAHIHVLAEQHASPSIPLDFTDNSHRRTLLLPTPSQEPQIYHDNACFAKPIFLPNPSVPRCQTVGASAYLAPIFRRNMPVGPMLLPIFVKRAHQKVSPSSNRKPPPMLFKWPWPRR